MKLKFSTKTLLWLTGVIVIAMATSIAALGYAFQIRHVLDDSILLDTREMLNAAELDITLLKQRNYLVLHMLTTSEEEWIEELENLEPISRDILLRFQGNPVSGKVQAIRVSLEQAFGAYDSLRNKVISLYKSGDRAGARNLALNELATLHNACAEICDELVQQKRYDILQVLRMTERESDSFSIVILVSISLTILLGSGLIWMLFNKVFFPLRQMAREVQDYSLNEKQEGADVNSHQDDLETLVRGLKVFMSEAAEAQSDLEQSRHELLQNRRLVAIGNTVAQVTHEIKNRLVVLGGLARSIEKRAGNAETVQKKAAVIFQEVNKLERLLKQITEFSKPIRIETEIFSLNALLEAMMPRLHHLTPKDTTLTMTTSPDLPNVRIDCERIEQVIINLIKNAIEAMGTGGRVGISAQLHENGAALVIRDEGPGMTEEVQARIFEPFFTTKKEGTGLGLAISRKIIRDHGGEMLCQSKPDQGTTFTILLPPA